MSCAPNFSPRLAIAGGTPVRSTAMPARIALGPDEEAMIAACLKHYRALQQDPGYQGVYEARYCSAFAAAQGGGYADAVATGTVAVFLAIAALDLPRGAQVICSPITDPGTLSAIILNGLVPRLADSCPGDYNMGVEQFQARITPEVRAVVVVHALGRPANISAIVAEAERHGIFVIEDCSQAHGATIGGVPVGTFGDIAAFSTMYRKAHITGASGGVVYTKNRNLYHQVLAHADRGKPSWLDGFDDRNPNEFLFPALNLHTDELSCAIGIASLARLKATLTRRRAFVTALAAELVQAGSYCQPYAHGPGDSPFVYPVVVDAARLGYSANEFALAVRAEGIPLNPHYRYVAAEWPFLKPYLADDFPTLNAITIRNNSFCLYLNENYGAQEVSDCVNAIIKVETA